MADTRRKNVNWRLAVNGDGTVPHHDAELAVLMDIRDELQGIRSLLSCYRIPRALDAIVRMDRMGVKRRTVRKRRAK